MTTRASIGVAIAVFMTAACAGQNPASPSATGTTAVAPSSAPGPSGVSAPMDYREEQIVFSGQVPPGSFSGTGDADFWVWCEHGGLTGNPQHPKNNYAGECNGAMTVNDVTKGVSGTVHMVPDATPSLGMDHVISVQASDGSIDCTLQNQLPLSHGPTTMVYVSCTTAPTPGASGTFTGAVVNITESPNP
jgi:hypothetical protein